MDLKKKKYLLKGDIIHRIMDGLCIKLSLDDYMSEEVYYVMKTLEQRKRVPILLLLREKGRMKITDIKQIIPEKTGSGSHATIHQAMQDLTNVGLVKTITRDEAKGWVDYELTELGRRVADHLANIIETIKKSRKVKRG